MSASAPTPSESDRAPRRGLVRLLWPYAIDALVIGLLLLLMTRFVDGIAFDPAGRIHYGMLARAFASGQTSLTIKPDPALLALPDPYDPAAHAKLALIDASLYQGQYYFYFGPAPAVARAVLEAGTRSSPSESTMCLLYAGVIYLALCDCVWLTLYRLEIHRTLLQRVLIPLMIGLTGLLPFLVARPSIYHEAILAGTACIAVALCGLLRPSIGWLAGSMVGVGCALAVACRLSLLPIAGAIVIAAAWRTWREVGEPHRSKWATLTMILAPALAVALMLGAYNAVRFGNPLEFGGRYQLTGMLGAVQRLDVRCIPLNLASYFGYVPDASWFYPFLISSDEYRLDASPRWVLEGNFCSLLLLTPILLALPWSYRLWRTNLRVESIWLAAGAGLTVLLVASLGWAAMRYAMDFLPVLTLLSLGAILTMSRRKQTLILWTALAVGSMTSFAIALAEMNSRHADRTLKLAYNADRAVAWVAGLFSQDGWQRRYLSSDHQRRALGDDYWLDAAQRPLAIFAVEGASIDITAGDAAGSGQFDVESLFDHTVQMQLIVNDTPLEPVAVAPGWQSLTVPGLESVQPGSSVRIEARFPDEPPRAKGSLWPMRLRGF
jgi:hypothetical protein